jgi:hypothetical protein
MLKLISKGLLVVTVATIGLTSCQQQEEVKPAQSQEIAEINQEVESLTYHYQGKTYDANTWNAKFSHVKADYPVQIDNDVYMFQDQQASEQFVAEQTKSQNKRDPRILEPGWGFHIAFYEHINYGGKRWDYIVRNRSDQRRSLVRNMGNFWSANMSSFIIRHQGFNWLDYGKMHFDFYRSHDVRNHVFGRDAYFDRHFSEDIKVPHFGKNNDKIRSIKVRAS